jgi:drug/metabolite transporter (DMT)-like permease
MIVSGILNLVAFWSLTRGLQRTPVAQANLLTSSQAVMATIAGWIVFGEVFNLQVAVGIVLALAAIVLSTLR